MVYNKKMDFLYLIIFITTFFIDRFSKWLVFTTIQNSSVPILPLLNFSVVWNRGVSFSLFHYETALGFGLLSFCVMLIIIAFSIYTYMQYVQNKNIVFEIIVLSGALSNMIDRFMYQGVLDFIDFYYGNWHFATFNLADFFVFIGILGIFLKGFIESNDKKN